MIPKAQIRIEKWGQVKDGNGNSVESINTAYNMWAEPVRLGGNRSDTSGQTKLNNSVQFKIRFRPDWKITGMWKLIYNGMRYSITEIQKLNEKRFNWMINCESPKTKA
jgi:SPP1 family predicted phage head-tail adaptor